MTMQGFEMDTTTFRLLMITAGALLTALPLCQQLIKHIKARIVDNVTALNDLKQLGNARHRKIRGTAVICGGR